MKNNDSKRKWFTWIVSVFICFFIQVKSNAQVVCPSCPSVLFVHDSLLCNNMDLLVTQGSNGGANFQNTDSTALKACKNSKGTYLLTGSVQGQACSFNLVFDSIKVFGGSLVSTANNSISIQWGSNNAGTVQIFYTIPGGSIGVNCTGLITLKFNLINNPIASFFASPQPACFNSPTNINFNADSSVGAASYYWTFGDGYNGTGPNPSHNYSQPGNYNVCLYVSNTTASNGQPTQVQACPSCGDSICHTITIDALPGPDINCVATVCAGESVQYCTAALGCTSYNWSVVGGSIQSGNGSNCITVLWGSGNPQGTINLIATGCTSNYCPQGSSVSVPIIPSSASVSGSTIVCLNSNESYSLPTWPGTNYLWNVSGGQSINGNNTNTPAINIDWTTVGQYTITASYVDTMLGCSGNASLVVVVKPKTKITGPLKRCVGTSSSYSCTVLTSTSPVPSTWSIVPAGAVITSANGLANVTIQWPSVGTYTISAAAVNPLLACDTATFVVTVNPAPAISSIQGKDSICPGGTSIYSAISNMSGTFNWTITGGTMIPLSTSNDSIQVSWNPTGSYMLTVNQNDASNNCLSNTLIKNVFPYSSPNLLGATNVCADATVQYVITNNTNGNFNWYVTPANLATIVSGQGNDTAFIKWHGSNNPGGSTTVYLHYGICNKDSIAVTIFEPSPISIQSSGTLCPGGVTLSTTAIGSYTWSCAEHPITPSQNINLSSINSLSLPGHYSVQVDLGSGCIVSSTYHVLDVGRPHAQIYASGPLVYCLSSLPSMNLNALTSAGYTYQWFENGSPIGTGPSIAINSGPPANVNALGTYNFTCVVTYNGCTDTSNLITVTVLNCVSPGGGTGTNNSCGASIAITNVSNCNPFTVSINATSPLGSSIVSGTTSITHLDDNSVLLGNTTKTYTSIGLKQFKVCATVLLPNLSTCIVCKDTSRLVDIAAGFLVNDSCGKIQLTDQASVFAPATISTYAWSVGSYPSNSSVPLPVASFNNTSIASPILTITQQDTFIVTQTVTSSNGCVSILRDTLVAHVPDADFNVTPTCVGTSVNFINLFPAMTDVWNFGDASSSYTSPTSHAYAIANTYPVTHTVTNAYGCLNVVVKNIVVNSNPSCTITYGGPSTFCSTDSLVLQACLGYSNYQWYNNGVAVNFATTATLVVKQSGYFHFTATDGNGCVVTSDTVNTTVLLAPVTTITQSGSTCDLQNVAFAVPFCVGCFYSWNVDNVTQGTNGSTLSGMVGSTPFTIGTHTITVTVFAPNGCFKSDSTVVTFNSNPSVAISVAGNPSLICSNNLYSFTASSNASLPSWAWSFNSINIGNNAGILASAAGPYTVVVKDGLTACTSSTLQIVNESPNLTLFPMGCDSLCDTTHLTIPLPSLNGNITGYTIQWYDNAPPFNTIVGSGAILNANILGSGNHQLAVIVMAPNGCIDTSTVYDLDTYTCIFPLAENELTFTCVKNNEQSICQWQLQHEEAVIRYELQRSKDGNLFYPLESVTPTHHVNMPYRVIDQQPVNGINFYRVKVVDQEEHVTYSPIRALTFDHHHALLEVYPTANPAGIFSVRSDEEINWLQLVSLDGQILQTWRHLSSGLHKLDLSAYSSGIYLLKTNLGSSNYLQRIVK